jgi:hypothetical protein
MELIQILLPLTDNAGKSFPDALLRGIQHELTERFGGLTAYERSPAKGIWRQGHEHRKDDVVIVEVMTDAADQKWWQEFRKRVERDLQQDELVIRVLPIRRI